MKAPECWLADAFVAGAGSGNTAAVVLLGEEWPDDALLECSRSLAVPAVSFVRPLGPGRYAVRWFVPTGEIPSCGHGTLAATRVLLERMPETDMIHFDSPLGPLAGWRDESDPELVGITFPAGELTRWEVPLWVSDVVGVPVLDAWRTQRHGLLVVGSADSVHELAPDLPALATLPVVGIAVTARGSSWAATDADVVSRWFVPALGLEDQATGTAHCLIGPYWSARLGRTELTAYQASQRGAQFRLTIAKGTVGMSGRVEVTERRALLAPATPRRSS